MSTGFIRISKVRVRRTGLSAYLCTSTTLLFLTPNLVHTTPSLLPTFLYSTLATPPTGQSPFFSHSSLPTPHSSLLHNSPLYSSLPPTPNSNSHQSSYSPLSSTLTTLLPTLYSLFATPHFSISTSHFNNFSNFTDKMKWSWLYTVEILLFWRSYDWLPGVSWKRSRGSGTKKPLELPTGIFTSFFDVHVFSSARAADCSCDAGHV